MADDLKQRQAAAKAVYDKMVAMLLDFSPAEALTVSDIKCIARFAQTFSFDAFDSVRPTDGTP